MSDCFDHLVDAFEDWDRGFDEGCSRAWGKRGKSSFSPDPLHYHRKLHFKAIQAETEKAYLLRLSNDVGVWVPKSICRHLEESSVWVHSLTYSKCTRISF